MEAHALFKRGWSISAIARHLDCDRKIVRSYLSGDRVAGVRRSAAPDPLVPFVGYVKARFVDDPHLTVGELADAEQLMSLPPVPYPATIEVVRPVDDRATIAFRGNRYSVNPGIGGTQLTLRHRLGTTTLEVFTPAGALLVAHRLAPAGAGAVVRTPSHRAALEAAVLSQFSTEPCDRKANRPPGTAALADGPGCWAATVPSRPSTWPAWPR